jgi:histone arginine demethylase JMJD6
MKGAAKDWGACKNWTFDFFEQGEVGKTTVDISLDTKEAGKKHRQSLQEYISTIKGLHALDQGVDTAVPVTSLTTPESNNAARFTPYLRAWYFPEEHGHLTNDFPNPPEYFPDKFKKLDQEFQPPFTWIFIGPKGAYSPLHRDIWFTCAWMAQIVGRKRFIFFPPSDLKHVYRKVRNRMAGTRKGNL